MKVTVAGQQVNFEGPKGKMSVKLPDPSVKVEVKDGEVHGQRVRTTRARPRSLHGLTRTILANAAKGVSTGCERSLDIRGVGFRAEVKGKADPLLARLLAPGGVQPARGRDRRGRQGAAHRGQPAHGGADAPLGGQAKPWAPPP